jgi:hypothetical protein
LQHHGGFKDGKYTGPPSLVQFRNIRIKPIEPGATPAPGIFQDKTPSKSNRR